MKNKVFMKKTPHQKRQYLGAALKYISDGALDDRMIGKILPKVSIHEQYTIALISSYPAFKKAVACAQAGKVRSSAVFSRNNGGAVAVVITPLRSATGLSERRIIYIHAPAHHHRKGRPYEQNTQRPYSI